MPEPVELRMSLELHHTLLEAAPPGSAVEARLQAADTRYDILPGLEHYRWFVGTPDEAQALSALGPRLGFRRTIDSVRDPEVCRTGCLPPASVPPRPTPEGRPPAGCGAAPDSFSVRRALA